jgi:hypothetical protein
MQTFQKVLSKHTSSFTTKQSVTASQTESLPISGPQPRPVHHLQKAPELSKPLPPPQTIPPTILQSIEQISTTIENTSLLEFAARIPRRTEVTPSLEKSLANDLALWDKVQWELISCSERTKSAKRLQRETKDPATLESCRKAIAEGHGTQEFLRQEAEEVNTRISRARNLLRIRREKMTPEETTPRSKLLIVNVVRKNSLGQVLCMICEEGFASLNEVLSHLRSTHNVEDKDDLASYRFRYETWF